jgi:signal transduction histidine kinase
MKSYENNLFIRLAVTLAIIFFSILVMIVWWQMLFERSLEYYVVGEEKALESNIVKGIYSQPELIRKLLSDRHILMTTNCTGDVCVQIPGQQWYYQISPEYERLIENDKIRKLHMFFWETSFLVFILLVTIGYMFWIVSREKKIQLEKQEFLAMTTHELKHPVSVISLVLESLLRDSLPKDRIQEFLQKGLSEVKTLKKSLENILKLQELTFTKKRNVQGYNLQEYVKTILQNWQLHELNREERIRFNEVQTSENHFEGNGNLQCHVDPKDLQIILNNLIENALLYSTQDVLVNVGRDGKGSYLEVKDRGLGFTDDDKNNYQKMFFRSRRHDIQNIRGSGLGHYITKKLLVKHSIQIVLESDGENKGSTFKVYVK